MCLGSLDGMSAQSIAAARTTSPPLSATPCAMASRFANLIFDRLA